LVGLHGPEELNDATVLREHIRGYCIKHRNGSVLAAVLAILHHPHATATSSSPPHQPEPQPRASVPQKAPAAPVKQPKLPPQAN